MRQPPTMGGFLGLSDRRAAAWPPQLCQWAAQGIGMLAWRLAAHHGRGDLVRGRSVDARAVRRECSGAPWRAPLIQSGPLGGGEIYVSGGSARAPPSRKGGPFPVQRRGRKGAAMGLVEDGWGFETALIGPARVRVALAACVGRCVQRACPVERAEAASGGRSGWWRRLPGWCSRRRAAGSAARSASAPTPAPQGGAGTFAQQRVEVHVHIASGAGAAQAGRAAAEAAAAVLGGAPCGAGASPAKEAPEAGAAARRGRAGGSRAQARAPRPEGWAYAVWRHPLRPELRGVRCGGGAAWRALSATLPGGRYTFSSGARLRRYASEPAAVAGYEAEAAKHEAPLPAPLFDVLAPRAEEYEWEMRVAELTDDYMPLQVDVSVVHGGLSSDGAGIAVPIVPIRKAGSVLTIAIPADVCPWLSPHFAALGDPVHFLPAVDGQMATVAFVMVSSEGGAWMEPAMGSGRWAGDGRWPAARALVSLAASLPAAVADDDINPERDYSSALVPAAHALSPEDLDAVLGGALGFGPWRGLLRLRWPPPEPEPGGEGQIVGPDGQGLPGVVTPPDGGAAAAAAAPWEPWHPPEPPARAGGVANAARLQDSAAAAARAVTPRAKSAALAAGRARAARGRAGLASSAEEEDSAAEGRRGPARPRPPAASGRATVASLAAVLERLEASNQDVLRRMAMLETVGRPPAGGAGLVGAAEPALGEAAPALPASAPSHPQVLGPARGAAAEQAAVQWALQASGAPPLARFGQPVGLASPLPVGAVPAAAGAAARGPHAGATAGRASDMPLNAVQVAQARANCARAHGLPLADVTEGEVRRSAEGICVVPGASPAELAAHWAAVAELQRMPAGAAPDALAGLLQPGLDDGSAAAGKMPGARGAASMEMLRRDLQARPAAWAAMIRRNAEVALAGTSDDPDPRVRSLVEFVVRTGTINRGIRTAAYLGFGIARVADLLARGQLEAAEAVILLLLTALEQAQRDNGRSSGSVDSLRPFGHLAEPTWTAAAMAHTKDAASLAEIRKKFNDDRGGGKKIGMVRRLLQARTSLAYYLYSCMHFSGTPSDSPARTCLKLFPMAPPYSWTIGAPPYSSPRCRDRWKKAQVAKLQVNLIVVACSFLALCSRRRCPGAYRTGMGLSEVQRERLPHLLALAKQWSRTPCHMSGRGKMKLQAPLEFRMQLRGAAPEQQVRAPPPPAVAPFVASRATFCKQEAQFDPVYHLPVFEAAAYLDPELILRDIPLDHGLKAMRQSGSMNQIVEFASDLDRSHKLCLARPDEVHMGQACKLIPVYRDQHRDRIVWDRRIRNAAEHALQSGSQRLVSGHALCDYELNEGFVPVLFAEDASDFYPAFDSTPARARTNILGREVPTHLLNHTKAYAARRAELGEHCVVCVASLLMGDLNAIDFARGAHEAVLQAGGSLADAVRVQHHRPFPRGARAELLQIDDHIGLGQRAQGSRQLPRELVQSFAGAREQYAQVGLRAADDKLVAGASAGFALGAEVLSSGHIGAERLRRAGLALLSSGIAAHGLATGALLRRAVASWVHVVGFRRPAMCLLDEVFRALPAVPLDDDVFELNAGARQELMLLSMLAPTLVTNLKARVASRVVCSDASHHFMVAVEADVAQTVVREIWRHRDQRGWYTQLTSKEVAYIRAHKRLEDRAWLQDIDEELRPGAKVPRWHLLEVFDVLEVCSGRDAPWSSAHAAARLRVGPRIDPKTHPLWDLRSVRIVEWILFLIINGRVAYVHCAPPCATFSLARQPRLRSRARPLGLDPADPATRLGTVLLYRVLLILWAALKCDRLGSMEHPAGAYSWYVPALRSLLAKPGCGSLDFAACAFGAPYQMPTRLGLVSGGFLQPLARPCVHGRRAHSRPLVGATRAAPAAAYTAELCAVWAELTRAHLAARAPLGGPEQAPDAAGGRLEQPFVNDLIRCCRWRAFTCDPCPPATHVNRLEVRAHLRARAKAARQQPGTRQPFLLDSTVALGACSKGRSASRALNDDLKVGLPDVLGFDVYPGYDFAPTRLIPADGPSRGRGIAPPSATPPAWWRSAVAGDLRSLDQWTRVPRQRRAESEWCRMTFKLLLWKQKDFDSTLGYPGEGPASGASGGCRLIAVVWTSLMMMTSGARVAGEPPDPRPAVDLRLRPQTGTKTAQMRRLLLKQFETWLLALDGGCTVAELVVQLPRLVSNIVASYGQVLYSRGRSLKHYTETIDAIVDVEKSLRRHMGAAWDVSQAWQYAVPTRHRFPTSLPVLRALVALALSWRWIDMAVLIFLAFTCMLRPGEAHGLTYSDILLPPQLMADNEVCYVKVREPKARWAVARMEHARCDEVALVRLLAVLAAGQPPGRKIFSGSYQQFRRRHDALVHFLGIAATEAHGLTWRQLKSMEIYIQEVAAVAFVPNLSQASRELVGSFAAALPGLLARAV
ncbi:unnamed protein product, partial [Prorocentrum cordatum]